VHLAPIAHALINDVEGNDMNKLMFPVQTQAIQIPEWLHREAYASYVDLGHQQEELLNISECRGGFGTIELIAFLYARQFATKEERIAAIKRVFSDICEMKLYV